MQKQLDSMKDEMEQLRARTEQHMIISSPTQRLSPPQPETFFASPAQCAKVWTQDVECYFHLAGIIEDADRLKYVQLLLRGRVKWWWHQQLEQPPASSQKITTWDTFKVEIIRQFTDPNTIDRAE